jgi:hypothetical protein
MPYRAPDASAYTSMKKAIISYKSKNSLDQTKSRAPSFYGSYTPYYSQNVLRDGIYSNKFQSPSAQLILEGLVLYYDAGKQSSYSGSGNVINDLSPTSITYGEIFGPTYSSSNGGVFQFDGVNDYIQQSPGSPIYSENFTINCWFNTDTIIADDSILVSKQARDPDRWNYRLFLARNNTGIYGDVKPYMENLVGVGHSTNLVDGKWHMATFSRNTSENKLKLFLEGKLVAEHIYTPTSAPISDGEPVRVGLSEYYGGMWPFLGKIGSVFIYHRALSNDEILTNFEATKSRFGIP